MNPEPIVRPGGRTARVREAVLTATGDLLAEHGFAQLDLGVVARRAGVGRTTVYRRWGTPTGLIADLLIAMADESTPRTSFSSIAEDLRANARLVQRTLTDARQGRLFRAVIVAGACDERAAAALHGFYARRIDEWAPCVTEAIERGDRAAAINVLGFATVVFNLFFVNLVVTGLHSYAGVG
jgi:AcrR family transcriptional regulator